MKFRKTPPAIQREYEPISSTLRAASEGIDQGLFEEALSFLDGVSAGASSARQCQIVCLAAQALFAQGRFGEAAATFSKAWKLGRDTTVWFAAALGQVRAQLKNVDVTSATATAKTALQHAEERKAEFSAQAQNAVLNQGGNVIVDRAPIRPNVVAFRLGQQFLDEGEPEIGLWFFNKAIEYSASGACRARIAIAAIALQNEAFQEAYDGARAVLIDGHFRARTLPAWPVVIAAAQRMGQTGVDPRLIRGLAQARASVRGRARLIVARTLRSFNDPSWREFADVGAGEDPRSILQAEFLKMKLASNGRTADSNQTDDREIGDLLATPNLGPKEWLAAAKTALTARLGKGLAPEVSALISEGTARYGESERAAIIHGLALACRAANRNDLALEILRPVTGSVTSGRSQTVWLRAKVEAEQGNLAVASSLFLGLSNRTNIPARFRMLATLEWTRLAVQSGNVEALVVAGPQLLRATESISDYELLLDLARQMTMAPPEIADHAPTVFSRGERLAWAAFGAQSEPATAVEILFKLARRMSDFGANAAIVQTWTQLSSTKRDWLWCLSASFWQYLGLVAAAYRGEGRLREAGQLVDTYLNDPATPPHGLAELGIPHALDQLARGSKGEAFQWFEWIAGQAPTHVLCAYAYYWMALRAERAGDGPAVKTHVGALQLSLGSSLGLQWMKDLSVRGRLLAGESVGDLVAGSEFSEIFVQGQWEEIQRDLGRL